MPNRIIKESICTSEELEKLSAFHETVFYRLIVNCDDYGRMDARPRLLASRLFPLKKLPEGTVEQALRALAEVGLIRLYEVEGKPYLLLCSWEKHQQIRAKRSRFPAPDGSRERVNAQDSVCRQMISGESDCDPMISDDSKCPRNPIQSESESESVSESVSESERARDEQPLPQGIVREGLSEHSEALRAAVMDWVAYKRSRGEYMVYSARQTMVAEVREQAERFGDAAVIAMLEASRKAGLREALYSAALINSRAGP